MTAYSSRDRAYANRARLRAGETLPFEGALLRMVPGKEDGSKLEPGDSYYASFNTEQLLTVAAVELASGWVRAQEPASYAFDISCCIGVELVEA
jgi:hypothetical protein